MIEPYDENLGPDNQTSGMPKREVDRDSLFLQAKLKFVDGEDCGDVRVRNLSAGGLMAEAAVRAKRGDRVELELRNIGKVTGHVAWVAQGRFAWRSTMPLIRNSLASRLVNPNTNAALFAQTSQSPAALAHGQRPR